MRFSIALPNCKEGLSYPLPFADEKDIVRVAQASERLGYHSIWPNDHIISPRYVQEQFGRPPRLYEPLITLAYVAAVTSTIKMGTSVIPSPMREPVYLAKQAITLDVFSGGRFLLGVGVGAYREEFEAIHPDLKGANRGAMVDESIEALRLLLDQPVASFHGKYYRFENVELFPKSIQSPMPIYVGGNDINAIRRAARWAQGWMPAAQGVQTTRQGVETLRRECEAMGRDPAEIDVAPQKLVVMGKDVEDAHRRYLGSQRYQHHLSLRKSTLRNLDMKAVAEGNLVGSAQDIIDKVGKLADVGVTHCAAMNFASDTPDQMIEEMQWFAEEVMGAFR